MIIIHKLLYGAVLLYMTAQMLVVLAAPPTKSKTTTSSTSSSDKVIVGYYPNWLGADVLPINTIDFSTYTHINYAFALVLEGSSVPTWGNDWEDGVVKTDLPLLVAAAHEKNAKVLISIGGWSGSINFSKMASSKASRKAFTDWCVEQIKTYNIDGIDIDWEYPGRIGALCNKFDAKNDAHNFITLLSETRAAIGKGKELTIAGHIAGFDGVGNGAKESAIGPIVDRVNIMTYDINGGWATTTGANSPLDATGDTADTSSFSSGINYWLNAGVPASKLTAGLAFYGRSTTASENMLSTKSLYQAQISDTLPHGDSYDNASYISPYCPKDSPGLSGIWRFGNLITQGVLSSSTTAKKPWVRVWDKGTSTPWLFNPNSKTFLSYDDPESIKAKVNYAKSKDIAGVMVWSIDEDSKAGDLAKAASAMRS